MDWSHNLAYLVGLIASDGSLSKDGRHIDFTSKDFDQIQTFAGILGLKNKIGDKSSSYGKGRKYFRIQFSDVKFYRFLLMIGLFPNKTKTIKNYALFKYNKAASQDIGMTGNSAESWVN